MAATRSGQDRAFEELYSRYRDRIAAFILAKVHDHARAEDIAQDVFISALRRLRASDQEIAFKPWIYEIAKNACIDEFRRTKRAHEVSLEADEELGGDRRALLSVAPTPLAAVESKQSLTDLKGAFGVLSESHHKLLVMRELEGLSYSEIGSRTGMSRQVVESTLFRARRKLNEEYDELASGRRCEQVQALIAEGRAHSVRACGIRQRRQLTRHLAHCQPCRRKARLAGVDEQFVRPRTVAGKLAALLPFPLWRWPWGGRGPAKAAGARGGARHLVRSGSAKTAAGAGSAAPSVTLGQAALTAAALVAAGAGGGVVAGAWPGGHANRPGAPVRPVSGRLTAGSPAAGQNPIPATVAGGAAASARHSVGGSLARTSRARRVGPGKSSRTTSPGAAGPGGSSKSGGSASAGSPGSSSTGTPGSARGITAVSGVRSVVGKTTGAGSRTLSAVGSTTQKVTSTAGSTVRKVTSTVGGGAQSIGSTAGNTVSRVGSTAGGAVGGAGSSVGGAGSTAGGAGSAVSGAGSTVSGATSAAGGAADQLGSASGAAAKTIGTSTSGLIGQ